MSEGEEEDTKKGFQLEEQQAGDGPKKRKPARNKRRKAKKRDESAEILSYRHGEKRKNNPQVGLVTPRTDPDAGVMRWRYDPHLDPELRFDVGRAGVERLIDTALASGDADDMREALETLKRLGDPYLAWAGKAERTSFDVDTVSLHVHERIDPMSILSTARKRRSGKEKGNVSAHQPGLFDAPFENLPLRDAIDFYKHDRGWANRLVAGDSLLVMNSLLQKESMSGRVQMIYIDPPYGVTYGSNFQPFVNKRTVTEKDADLTQEPETIKAFRDTWELGLHSYLTYLRDRLLLSRELLSESGSIFVQISDENLHHVRELMDEVFGAEHLVVTIPIKKKGGQKSSLISPVNDYLLWYTKANRVKDAERIKFRPLFEQREFGPETLRRFNRVLLPNGREVPLNAVPLSSDSTTVKNFKGAPGELFKEWPGARLFYPGEQLTSGGLRPNQSDPVELYGLKHVLKSGLCWKTTTRTPDDSPSGMDRLRWADRLVSGRSQHLNYKRFLDDFGFKKISNWWDGLGGAPDAVYVVQTNTEIVKRCILMTTDPGDLVFDPTCGSGTTAVVAEKWGRRWITCDTSRVALTLAKQRLVTAAFDYYELRFPHEGVRGGFQYETVPHVTLGGIANNTEVDLVERGHRPKLDQALARLNQQLAVGGVRVPITFGARAGGELAVSEHAGLEEWEVPNSFQLDWPESVRGAFDDFFRIKSERQNAMRAVVEARSEQETLYDRPKVAKSKVRICGPFTVEAVPFPAVTSLDEAEMPTDADASVARSGESARQHQWRDELLRTGIRGKAKQKIELAELEPLSGTRYLHCAGTLTESNERVVASFGPEHAPLEQRQVALALAEAEKLRPAPRFIVFCAFNFDPEAAKDIDETNWPGVTLLKAQMNPDLLTEDLKRKRASNESFWLIGQPDVELRRREDGRWEAEVNGFDYFDTAKGDLVSGGKSKIAMWMLDTDYDERSLMPQQLFFPMAGKADGWGKLRKDLRTELDESRLEKFHGTLSLPFDAGENRRVAVKLIDDRGIESLKIVPIPDA